MPVLYMPIGVPGSGKSTYYKNNFNEDETVLVSSDAIRKEVFGDENDQEHNSEVFELMRKRTIEALKNNKDVYYDSTNISSKRRIGLFNCSKDIRNAEKVAIVFCTPLEVAIERNNNRERKVPKDVIISMAKRFDVPHMNEGYSDIILYREDSFLRIDLLKKIMDAENLSHDNPHHRLTIGKHMEEAYKYACCSRFPSEVCFAALYHDVAKPLVKDFHNIKGEATEEAHYYGHDKLSAYMYLSYCKRGNETESHLLEVANLISNHMIFFNKDINLKKFEMKYGSEFLKKLELLHDCDTYAH